MFLCSLAIETLFQHIVSRAGFRSRITRIIASSQSTWGKVVADRKKAMNRPKDIPKSQSKHRWRTRFMVVVLGLGAIVELVVFIWASKRH
jgi:hypothetical protein